MVRAFCESLTGIIAQLTGSFMYVQSDSREVKTRPRTNV